MSGDVLNNINTELDEIMDRLDTLIRNKELSRDNRQNINIASNYISAATRVINDVYKEITK